MLPGSRPSHFPSRRLHRLNSASLTDFPVSVLPLRSYWCSSGSAVGSAALSVTCVLCLCSRLLPLDQNHHWGRRPTRRWLERRGLTLCVCTGRNVNSHRNVMDRGLCRKSGRGQDHPLSCMYGDAEEVRTSQFVMLSREMFVDVIELGTSTRWSIYALLEWCLR